LAITQNREWSSRPEMSFLAPVGEHDRAHDVELPQLHRHRALPADVVLTPALAGLGLHQVVAHQHPVDRGAGQLRNAVVLGDLVEETPWPPAAVGTPQLADELLDLGVDLARMAVRASGAVSQPGEASVLVAVDPGVHRLAGHAVALRHRRHAHPGHENLQHCVVALLRHGQLQDHGPRLLVGDSGRQESRPSRECQP
jgi:hypothetical protein